jgi:hypothetical protein
MKQTLDFPRFPPLIQKYALSLNLPLSLLGNAVFMPVILGTPLAPTKTS